MQYFIKRGKKVHGPYSDSQIKTGLISKKLSEKDLMGSDRNGPWKEIKDVHGAWTSSKGKPIESEDEILDWLNEDSETTAPRSQKNHTGDNVSSEKPNLDSVAMGRNEKIAKEHNSPEANSQSNSMALYVDEQIEIWKNRISVKKVAVPEGNYHREDDAMLSLDPRKISSFDLASGFKVLPAKTLPRTLIYLGTAIAFLPTAVWFLFLFLEMFGDISDLDHKDLQGYLKFVMIFVAVGVPLILYGSLALILQAKKHVLKINIGGKHTLVPFREKEKAMEVYKTLEGFR